MQRVCQGQLIHINNNNAEQIKVQQNGEKERGSRFQGFKVISQY